LKARRGDFAFEGRVEREEKISWPKKSWCPLRSKNSPHRGGNLERGRVFFGVFLERLLTWRTRGGGRKNKRATRKGERTGVPRNGWGVAMPQGQKKRKKTCGPGAPNGRKGWKRAGGEDRVPKKKRGGEARPLWVKSFPPEEESPPKKQYWEEGKT